MEVEKKFDPNVELKADHCIICKTPISSPNQKTGNLDPCSLTISVNVTKPRQDQREQTFPCHFECFRKLISDDGILFIMDPEYPTVGELSGGEIEDDLEGFF